MNPSRGAGVTSSGNSHLADYRARAEQHRPRDLQAIAAEALRLHRDGLTPADIAAALRLNLEAVREMLYPEAA